MVEWKKIKDLCRTIAPPIKIATNCYSEMGAYPIIDQGQKSVVGYTDSEDALLGYNEYVLFGDHTRFVKYYKGRFAQGADGLKILLSKTDIDCKYLYYAFSNVVIPSRGYSRHWSIAKELEIPLPSLSEQKRIVDILDTFTASITNLKEQIKERRKQYEHYRDQLLILEGKEGVEWKELGEVCEINRGVRVVKKNLEVDGLIPVYQNSLTPLGYYENSNYPANTTFVISAGAAGEIGFSKTPFWAADDCLGLTCPDGVLDKYVFAFLKTKQMYLKSKVRKASVPRLSRTVVEQLQIPLPSLQTQSRIVTIIDEFESSIANLESQLKEREKQYEYYRNQLLTFE